MAQETAENTNQQITYTLPDTGYIRQAQLIKIIPFSASTLWRKVNTGSFPKPVKLSERVTAWRAEDVRKWMNSISSNGGA